MSQKDERFRALQAAAYILLLPFRKLVENSNVGSGGRI